MQTATTVERMIVSRRRRELIIPTTELIPGMVASRLGQMMLMLAWGGEGGPIVETIRLCDDASVALCL